MKKNGQAMIEFCFGATVFMLLVAGLIQVVRWTMMNLVEGRVAYEQRLTDSTQYDAAHQLGGGVVHRMRPIDSSMYSK